jgi:hypothetical protein
MVPSREACRSEAARGDRRGRPNRLLPTWTTSLRRLFFTADQYHCVGWRRTGGGPSAAGANAGRQAGPFARQAGGRRDDLIGTTFGSTTGRVASSNVFGIDGAARSGGSRCADRSNRSGRSSRSDWSSRSGRPSRSSRSSHSVFAVFTVAAVFAVLSCQPGRAGLAWLALGTGSPCHTGVASIALIAPVPLGPLKTSGQRDRRNTQNDQ